MKRSHVWVLGLAVALPALYLLFAPDESPSVFRDYGNRVSVASEAAEKGQGAAAAKESAAATAPEPTGLVAPRPIRPKALPPEAQSLARAVVRAEAKGVFPGPAEAAVESAEALMGRTATMLAEKGYTLPGPGVASASDVDGSRDLETLQEQADALRERLDAH